MYAAVVGATALVTAIGLAALTAVRIESRSVHGSGDSLEAMLYARSAVEMGLLRIRNDPNWRTNFVNGVWESNRRIGQGTYTLEGIDPVDGILGNLLNEPLLLRGIGVKGESRYKLQVRLESTGVPLTCLEAAACAGNDVQFNGAAATGTGIVSANNNVQASGGSIIALPVAAAKSVSGSIYLSTKSQGITPRTLPASTVFDFYVSNGTVIDLASLPKSGGIPAVQNILLSPTNNPYGATNPKGIYVIDRGSGQLTIQNAQIIGTLVVLGGSKAVSVLGSVNMAPAVANYPTLLVQGNLTLSYTNLALLLNSLSLPSQVTGIVYGSNDVTTANIVTLIGVLVAGNNLKPSGTLALTYSATYRLTPPPGFGNANDKLDVVAGSWTRVVD